MHCHHQRHPGRVPPQAPLNTWILAGGIQSISTPLQYTSVFIIFLPAPLTMSNPVHTFSKRESTVCLCVSCMCQSLICLGLQKINGLSMSYLDPLPIPHQSLNVFVSFLPSQGICNTHNILPSPLFTPMLRGHFLKYRIFFQGLDHLSPEDLNDFMSIGPSTTETAFTG